MSESLLILERMWEAAVGLASLLGDSGLELVAP